MSEFYDRYRELGQLKEKYDSLKKGELCVLYGRRRIGKTELVLKFLDWVKGKKGKNIYLYVNKLARKSLMQQFSKDIKDQTNDDIRIDSLWGTFFDYIIEESTNQKLVLIIDEFQRLEEISEDFLTMLQHQWDTKLRFRKIMIILLGSSMGMTHNLVFSSKGPLYGRSTLNQRIRPFRYVDFREMFTYLGDEEEMIKFYSAFGGTAHYLALAKNQQKPLFDTIKELILTEGSPLIEEPLTLLSSELRSYTRHNSILISIAKGKKEMSEIADELGLEQGQITPHLDHLTNKLDLVQKHQPLFGKKKKTRYDLEDNFFKFWYRFVFLNKSTLELGNQDLLIKKIKFSFENYISFIFENIVKELLILYNGDQINKFKINFEKIGSWWEKDEEIDVVAYSKRELLVGEVKWKNKPINGLTIFNELEEKSRKLNFKGRVNYLIVSKLGFSEDTRQALEERKVLCLDLKDITLLFQKVAKKESTKQRTLNPFFS